MTAEERDVPSCVVFYDPGYPSVVPLLLVDELLPVAFSRVDASGLSAALAGADMLVLAHGSLFPKGSWAAIRAFLGRGGNLVALGGVPCTRPVRDDGTVEPEQVAYSAELLLGPVFPVELPQGPMALRAAPAATALLDGCPLELSGAPGQFWASYPKLTQGSDHPEELGSAGPIDTLLTPLLYATVETANGVEQVAALATLCEQRAGRFAGGRWLLVPWQPAAEEGWRAVAAALRRMIALLLEPTQTLELRPVLACYQPGERPAFVVAGRADGAYQLHITIYDPTGAAIYDEGVVWSATTGDEVRVSLPAAGVPGLYRATLTARGPGGSAIIQTTGLWVWDAPLVQGTVGAMLRGGRDHFYQKEQIFHIFGTTYMDSVVQRRFLTLPNPARWDADFAAMRAAGVNTIRTGIWTAWRQLMPLAGYGNEALLRALDAFVLTACAHQMQVIFTFFSFSPPLFEGENPWFDPRSLAGQEAFVATIARRYKEVELLSWDLINEPSFGDPKAIFSQRPQPNRDRHEVAAFQRWLQEQWSLEELQLRWRCTPSELPDWGSVQPPEGRDFSYRVGDTEGRRMLRAADYTRFSQEAVRDWAARMRAAIRAAGSKTLVGMGQDESGSRPAPQFYAAGVDYTTTHPWWNNDALLWDMLLDKTPHAPNLIQETGVMLVRDIDGHPWRTEEEVATLLERKLVLSLAARGAGMIQWLWHTNGLMTSDNENSIGLLRADGTVKAEYRAMREWGRLVAQVGPRLLPEGELPPVWVVVPYSQWFVRPDWGIAASQRAVRALGYECGIIPQLVGEQQVAALLEREPAPQLLVVPGLQLLREDVWRALRGAAERGATLLVNGVLGRDEHNLPYDTGIADVPTDPRPVRRCEQLWGLPGGPLQWTFGGDGIGTIKRAHSELRRLPLGAGMVLWSGLPVELGDSPAALGQLYRHALGLPLREASETPLLVVRRQVQGGELLLFVSEAGQEQRYEGDGRSFTIGANRAGAALISEAGVATFGGVS